MKTPNGKNHSSGFTVIEPVVGIAITLVVAAFAIPNVVATLRAYRLSESAHVAAHQPTEIGADMHDHLRSAIDLIIQEVGQAGSLPSGTLGARNTNGAVFASGVAQAASLNDDTGLFVGEKLLVDAGANQELPASHSLIKLGSRSRFRAPPRMC